MDNSVKIIKIDDIIPVESESNNIDEINNLAESIKEYGIIEPLIVKENNNKYEIISGKKRYQAALIAGQKDIPVLVRDIDKNYYKQNNNKAETNTNKFINPIIGEEKKEKRKKRKDDKIISQDIQKKATEYPELNLEKYKTTNNDIINLSELNKEEIERDELKMNNNMLNNQQMQQEPQMNAQQNNTPTFGGRFFPSLEDEPTNMNMGGMNFVGEQATNPLPSSATNTAPTGNNLIDLTDVNNEQEPQMNTPQQAMNLEQIQQANQMPEQSMPEVAQSLQQENQQPEPMLDPMNTPNLNQFTQNEVNIDVNSIPQNDFIPQSEPMLNNQSISQNEVPVEPLNQGNELPQFDMSQSVRPMGPIQPQEPTTIENLPQNDFAPQSEPTPMTNIPALDNQPMQPGPQMNNVPNINNEEVTPTDNIIDKIPTLEPPTEINNNLYNTEPVPQQDVMSLNPTPTLQENNNIDLNYQNPISIEQQESKNVEPVLNTIETLANNLKEFGYDIQITKEDLISSSKITIEIKR